MNRLVNTGAGKAGALFLNHGSMAEIRYVRHKDIDQEKWDQAIDKSYNGLIYGYSFMLNQMAGKRWDALIQGDYEAIFPLAWNTKFGMPYLYQPYLCQQLGLFSRNKTTKAQVE